MRSLVAFVTLRMRCCMTVHFQFSMCTRIHTLSPPLSLAHISIKHSANIFTFSNEKQTFHFPSSGVKEMEIISN